MVFKQLEDVQRSLPYLEIQANQEVILKHCILSVSRKSIIDRSGVAEANQSTFESYQVWEVHAKT